MLHLFQDALSAFESLKAKIEGAASAATAAVANSVTWSEDEIKAAEVAVFTKVETTSMTLSQAFAEGAKWAAARVQNATAPAAATVAATTAVAPAAPVAQPAVVAAVAPAAAPAPVAAPAVAAAPATTPAPAVIEAETIPQPTA
jgi:pyruvate dehydrogenase E2 component (dihydrolipoamide acetyltransferase)